MTGCTFKKEGAMPTYAEQTQRWTTLCANAEPLLGSVPAAQELHAGFKVETAELGSLADRIQDLQGQAHTLAKRRKELIRKVSEGRDPPEDPPSGTPGTQEPRAVEARYPSSGFAEEGSLGEGQSESSGRRQGE
jgi:hypothetical protein